MYNFKSKKSIDKEFLYKLIVDSGTLSKTQNYLGFWNAAAQSRAWKNLRFSNLNDLAHLDYGHSV